MESYIFLLSYTLTLGREKCFRFFFAKMGWISKKNLTGSIFCDYSRMNLPRRKQNDIFILFYRLKKNCRLRFWWEKCNWCFWRNLFRKSRKKYYKVHFLAFSALPVSNSLKIADDLITQLFPTFQIISFKTLKPEINAWFWIKEKCLILISTKNHC